VHSLPHSEPMRVIKSHIYDNDLIQTKGYAPSNLGQRSWDGRLRLDPGGGGGAGQSCSSAPWPARPTSPKQGRAGATGH
jgi:hypothetical protein